MSVTVATIGLLTTYEGPETVVEVLDPKRGGTFALVVPPSYNGPAHLRNLIFSPSSLTVSTAIFTPANGFASGVKITISNSQFNNTPGTNKYEILSVDSDYKTITIKGVFAAETGTSTSNLIVSIGTDHFPSPGAYTFRRSTIVDNGNGFIGSGLKDGQKIRISGASSTSNNCTFQISKILPPGPAAMYDTIFLKPDYVNYLTAENVSSEGTVTINVDYSDGGTYFPASATIGTNKMWQRQYNKADGLNAQWFGAVGNANYQDTSTPAYKWFEDSSLTIEANDDTTAIQAAFDTAANTQSVAPNNSFALPKVIIPVGRYLHSTIKVPLGILVTGAGAITETISISATKLIMMRTDDPDKMDSFRFIHDPSTSTSIGYWYGMIRQLCFYGEKFNKAGWAISLWDYDSTPSTPIPLATMDMNAFEYLHIRNYPTGGIWLPNAAVPLNVNNIKGLLLNGPLIKIMKNKDVDASGKAQPYVHDGQSINFTNISCDHSVGGAIWIEGFNSQTGFLINNLKSEAGVGPWQANDQVNPIILVDNPSTAVTILNANHQNTAVNHFYSGNANNQLPGDLISIENKVTATIPVTLTIASPALISLPSSSAVLLTTGTTVKFFTMGTLPYGVVGGISKGIKAGVDYTVKMQTGSTTDFTVYQTATAGTSPGGSLNTSSTITLDTTASGIINAYVDDSNFVIVITGGTGAGTTEYVITGYDTSTKIASISPATFSAVPDDTSTYKILQYANTSGFTQSGTVTINVQPIVTISNATPALISLSATGLIQNGDTIKFYTDGVMPSRVNTDGVPYGISAGQVYTVEMNSATDFNVYQVIETGTATDGSTTTIQLAANAPNLNGAYWGSNNANFKVSIIGGAGSGHSYTITGYNGTSKTVTIDGTFTTKPDNTSIYNVLQYANTSDCPVATGKITLYKQIKPPFTASYPRLKWSGATFRVRTTDRGINPQLICNSSIPYTITEGRFNLVEQTINSRTAQLNVGGSNISGAAWTGAGINFRTAAATYTDLSSSATGTGTPPVPPVSLVAINSFNGGDKLNSTNAVTYTDAANVYITAGPTAVSGGNATITNSYALRTATGALVKFTGDVYVGNGTRNPVTTAPPDAMLQLFGTKIEKQWGTNGIQFRVGGNTMTDNTTAGGLTPMDVYMSVINGAVLTFTNSGVNVGDFVSLYIGKPTTTNGNIGNYLALKLGGGLKLENYSPITGAGTITAQHFAGNTTAPTVVPGTTNANVSVINAGDVTGNDAHFTIVITTTGSFSGVICNLQFACQYSSTPVVVCSCANLVTATNGNAISMRASSATTIVFEGTFSVNGTYTYNVIVGQ